MTSTRRDERSLVALAVGPRTAGARRTRFDAAALQAWVEGTGAARPVVFIGIYAAATVLFLPGAVVTLAGGALFGPVWGTLWNLGGARLGAALRGLPARECTVSFSVFGASASGAARVLERVLPSSWPFGSFLLASGRRPPQFVDAKRRTR